MTGSGAADTIAPPRSHQGIVLTTQRDGILLINLGSPATPAIADVRRYLDEFLMDPYVLGTPWLIRRLIVSLFILPTRPRRSAHAYTQIWREPDATGFGSPLLQYSARLRDALADGLGLPVELGMRYGEPSIESAIETLSRQHVSRILVVPLYPQHADSTTTTALEVAREAANSIPLIELPPFYDRPDYLAALAAVTREHLPDDFDLLLMSYHGLPERHMVRADPTGGHCLKSPHCCETGSAAHITCYRHQTRVTSRLLAEQLGLTTSRWTMSYQSRLGRLPWLSPYTDQTLRELPSKGVRKLAVVCPAFVADNLETLEEIAITGRKTFLDSGGESLTLIPCLNDHPAWVQALGRHCAEVLAEARPV
jgi:ferrochelatase